MKFLKITLAISLAFFVKLFVFQPFVIPSSSMDRTLVKGDYVMVNKWQNSVFGNHLNIINGDVLAFHYPLDKGAINNKMVFIKRCVATPGDFIRIVDGEVKNDPSNIQFDYLISDTAKKLNWGLLKPLDIHLGGRASNNRWLLSLDSTQIEAMNTIDSNFVYSKNSTPKNKADISTFPSDSSLHWNRDFYGPLYVPKKGDSISLNSSNIKLYTKIIKQYENHKIRIEDSLIYVDDRLVNTYTFEQNYYFMLGDNRHHSQDSRYWGFAPENHIIGRCSLILFNAEQFSTNRLFKKVY